MERQNEKETLAVTFTSVLMTPAFNVKEIPSPSVQFVSDEAAIVDLAPRVACDSYTPRNEPFVIHHDTM